MQEPILNDDFNQNDSESYFCTWSEMGCEKTNLKRVNKSHRGLNAGLYEK